MIIKGRFLGGCVTRLQSSIFDENNGTGLYFVSNESTSRDLPSAVSIALKVRLGGVGAFIIATSFLGTLHYSAYNGQTSQWSGWKEV